MRKSRGNLQPPAFGAGNAADFLSNLGKVLVLAEDQSHIEVAVKGTLGMVEQILAIDE